ncbi:hypothetical protein IAR55_004400 [Kwoniella newhampshirensis]|uniref:Uncharacterized protein n=1 Tax=Kwoniella newhampshirensis TaxID=1651941 RepID=A0AAW0YXQ6_9TREE
MGLFTLRKRAPTLGSPIMTNSPSSSSTTTLVPSPLPAHRTSSTFGRSSKTPSPIASSPVIPESPPISLRVAIDPLPSSTCPNPDARELFYVTVSAEEGVAALRREIARTVGHSSMSLFKVSIPWQAHYQARAYTERYGKQVDLLASFPAFNVDDPQQLGLSLDSAWKEMTEAAVIASDLKIKHWFPNHTSGPSDVISIIARPLQEMTPNAIPLTLRAYFSAPSDNRSHINMSGSSSRSHGPPLVIDVDPYITVNELKSELLRASGRDGALWRFVVVWQIAMTDGEMTVIDELGRLKDGKMPWPYPPGAMEPIPMTDGNLPVSLFFPKSAPNGDMLNLSVWLNPKAGPDAGVQAHASTQQIPAFRYPMTFAPQSERPASMMLHSPPCTPATTTATLPPTPVVELPMLRLKPKSARSRARPSTAPAIITSDPSNSSQASTPKPPAFGTRSTAPQIPLPSRPSHTKRSPHGLGIVTFPIPPQLDRSSFSSTVSTSEDEGSIPSLNFSQLSIETPDAYIHVKTPDIEPQDWLMQDHLQKGERMGSLRKTASVKGGSLSSRVRRAAAARS